MLVDLTLIDLLKLLYLSSELWKKENSILNNNNNNNDNNKWSLEVCLSKKVYSKEYIPTYKSKPFSA